MAALIERETGVGPRLVRGRVGEFSVWMDDRLILRQKGWFKVPPDDRVLAAVRQALQS